MSTSEKIKPLSLFTRNHTESHDRGITYHIYSSTSVTTLSIFFTTVREEARRRFASLGYNLRPDIIVI